MLDQTIHGVSEENWIKTVNGWTYADVVYHILITQKFYIRDTPKGMEWGGLYGNPGLKDTNPIEYFPDKDTLVKYKNEVERDVENYLKSINDEDLIKSDGFKGHLPTVHLKLLYLLRHNSHHLGELALVHRSINLNRIRWT